MNANIGDLWMPTICLLGLFASLGASPVPSTGIEKENMEDLVAWHCVLEPLCEQVAQSTTRRLLVLHSRL